MASDSNGLFESGGAESVVYGLGLDYEGNPFVESSGGKKTVKDFYIVEGDYDPSGASIYTRYSATTDYVPPEAGGNDVWDQNARPQVPRMLDETGARGIVVEDKQWYNTENQPDRGVGVTLDQQNGDRLGAPEFLCGSVDKNGVISQGGRASISNGGIYKVSGGKKVQVSKIVNGKIVKMDE